MHVAHSQSNLEFFRRVNVKLYHAMSKLTGILIGEYTRITNYHL